jgi:hypothetical protein
MNNVVGKGIRAAVKHDVNDRVLGKIIRGMDEKILNQIAGSSCDEQLWRHFWLDGPLYRIVQPVVDGFASAWNDFSRRGFE